MFIGTTIDDKNQYDLLKNKCYVHELKKDSRWVDCAAFASLGFCPLSLANDPSGLRDENNKPAKANCEVKYVNHPITRNRTGVKLQNSSGFISNGSELTWDYGEGFSLTGAPPATLKLYKRAISVFIKENEENMKFYDTVQGDGYCGMLAILQTAFNTEKIHLERLKDRQWVIQKILEMCDNNEIGNDRVQNQFRGMIEHLLTLPNHDFPHSELPFLPSSTNLWISSSMTGTALMKKYFNFNLWAIDNNLTNITQRFYQYYDSNDTEFVLSYRNWKQNFFNNNYKNIFYRDSHFFQGPGYTSEFLSNKFDEAVNDLINNIVAFICCPSSTS